MRRLDLAPPARLSRRRGTGPLVESLLSFALGLLLAVLVRRPQDLATTVPGDARDPVLLSWVLAWPGHALTSADRLWDGNVFAPVDNSFAFTDALLGYLPFSLVGQGPGAALVRYNVVLLLAFALAFAGVYVLVRQLGLGRGAALVAATAFAFNPWRVSQLNHLQVLSSGGIPLALAMLARGHGIRLRTGGPPRPAWVVAGWLVATWQISLGWGLGLQTAYLLAVCTAVAAVRAATARFRGGRWPDRRLVAAHAVGIVTLLGVSAALAQPYFAAVEDHPNARRPVSEVTFYSPAPGAFVTAPAESWLWGRYTAERRADVPAMNEKALFPGLVATGLAVVGAVLPGRWSVRRRVVLAGAVIVLAVCALGTSGPAGGRLGYLLLYDLAPGWQGVRTPSRLVTVAWLGLALLAAHGVVALRQALRSGEPVRDAAVGTALVLGLSGFALLEGLDTAGASTVRPPPVRLAALPQPVMVLPSEEWFDQEVMRWSTDGFPDVVNGISGFNPQELLDLRDAADRLPDPAALTRLRASGVQTLVVLPDAVAGTRYEGLDAAALSSLPGVVVEQRGDVLVAHLSG